MNIYAVYFILRVLLAGAVITTSLAQATPAADQRQQSAAAAASAEEEEGAPNEPTTYIWDGTQTDDEICQGIVQDYYLSLESSNENDESTMSTSSLRDKNVCSCQVSSDNLSFVLECRLDYCQQDCNEAGICAVVAKIMYDPDVLRKGQGDLYVAQQGFAQCYEHTEEQSGTTCLITDPNTDICTLEVNGSVCNSCTVDYELCAADGGGMEFDCTNLESGIIFNSCNEVTERSQTVDLNSPFAFVDANSLVFESCNDPANQVLTPSPNPESTISSGGSTTTNSESSSSATPCKNKKNMVATLAVSFLGIFY